MFKIKTSDSFFWPITVNIPTDGGQYTSATFDAAFKRLGQDELDKLVSQVQEGTISDRQLADKILVGWKGVVDDDDKEVPFSASTKQAFLNISGIATSLVVAFTKALEGAREKN